MSPLSGQTLVQLEGRTRKGQIAAAAVLTGLLASALAAGPALLQAGGTLLQRHEPALAGDQALTAIASLRAASFHQLLGVYSRYGFHELGPAMFYLLAPFVSIFGPARGVYVGSAIINAAALAATVWIVFRNFGPRAALWASAAMSIYTLCVDVRLLRQPWNPYLAVMPMMLFILLWALTLSARRGAWVWMCAVGSYELQTHLATGPFVGSMVLVATAASLVSARRSGRWWLWRDATREPLRLIGALTLGAMWLPPAFEAVIDHPSNVALLWRFFTSAHHSLPPLRVALRAAASAISVVPFGEHIYVLSIARSRAQLVAAAAGIAAASLVTLLAAWRRSQPAAAYLVLAGLAGAVLGSASLTRAVGGDMAYFTVWLSFVPVAVLIGLGIALVGDPPPGPRPKAAASARSLTTTLLLAAAIAAALPPLVKSDSLHPAAPANAPLLQVMQKLERATATVPFNCRGRTVIVGIGQGALWPEAAGIATRLSAQGCEIRTNQASYAVQFGRYGGRSRVAGNLGLYLTPAPAGSGKVLAQVGNQVLTWRPAASPA